jgi:5'-nucleotidase
VNAVRAGLPAGLIMPTAAVDDEADHELRIAFDFDGVLADDKSEQVYQEHKNLDLFHQHETDKVDQPHEPGPLKDLFTKIGFFQKLEAQREANNPRYKPAMRVAIVTARNAPSNERLVTTLNSWGMDAAELFLMGGIEKRRVLEVLKPHIFFDDQLTHLEPAAQTVPSVLIPFGVANVDLLANIPPDGAYSPEVKE